MHPILFLAIVVSVLGLVSYGVALTPLEPQAKRWAHLGIVAIFVAYLAQHFGLLTT